jgi:TctA family transporter
MDPSMRTYMGGLLFCLESYMFISYILKIIFNIIFMTIYTKILSISWQYIARLHNIPSLAVQSALQHIMAVIDHWL